MARSRPRDYDDDDDDDRPRRKKRRRDDDDDDDDRGSGGGNGTIIAVAAAGGGLLLVGIIVIAIFALRSSKKAEEEEAVAAANVPGPGPMQVGPGPNPLGLPGGNPFVPPKPQPQPKENEPQKFAAGVLPIPPANIGLEQVVFAGGASGHTAVITFADRGGGHRVDVVKTATGESVGSFIDEEAIVDVYAVAPDGKHFAGIKSEPFVGNSINLFTVVDGKPVKAFRPYPKNNDLQVPDLIWIAFPAADRLMTVTAGGGFDVWKIPSFERVAGATNKLKPGMRTSMNGFTHSPDNFGLSPDGSQFAIFNGAGFTIYNTAAAAEVARTSEIVPALASPLFTGAAWSPDGSRFACHYQIFDQKTDKFVQVWSAKDGSVAAGGKVDAKFLAPAGFAFWGPSHLVFWEGGIASGRVFDLASLQEVAKVRTTTPGKFGTIPPSGDLWAVTGLGRTEQKRNSTCLVKAAAPNSLPMKSVWTLGAQGLVMGSTP